MTTNQTTKGNLLGDLRAEADQKMLREAFFETGDYRTLIETSDRSIVVGRRGTGKSALAIKLQQHWNTDRNAVVIKLTPEEHHTIGLRPLLKLFGDRFSLVRAGSRLAWRYGLFMEIARSLATRTKFRATDGYRRLQGEIRDWSASASTMEDRFHGYLSQFMRTAKDNHVCDKEARIGLFARYSNILETEEALASACAECSFTIIVLIDRLDEGYEPDATGIGMIDGLVQAAIDVKTRIPEARITVFLRDNIFRSIQQKDPDYSRNIEGHTLRLHWNVETLFTLAAVRLRVAFEMREEATRRIWNRHTAGELKGIQGFEKCLQLTLYRPRDLLSLLNEAFHRVQNEGHGTIALTHIESSGRYISRNRFEDLKREYEAIFPGLPAYLSIFEGRTPHSSTSEVAAEIDRILEEETPDSRVRQELLIMRSSESIVHALYSIGFLGVRDSSSGAYVFSHDGRSAIKDFLSNEGVLVHPCYWMALNCTRRILTRDESERIFDEYDVEVSSDAAEIRSERIRTLEKELTRIEEGESGAHGFEHWCHRTVRICFAKGLTNVELKPNGLAKQRRDIVGTNLAEAGVWKRIYEDYGTRQVVFEVKNYRCLVSSDYYQMRSYLSGEYGRIGFFITRDDSTDLYRHRDVEWVREMYAGHKVLIVKITGKYLSGLLNKLRNPLKHDAVDDALHKLLDLYVRRYLSGQVDESSSLPRRQKKRRKKGSMNRKPQSSAVC